MTTRCYGLMHSELISVPHILTNVSALDEALREAQTQPVIWDQKYGGCCVPGVRRYLRYYGHMTTVGLVGLGCKGNYGYSG